MGNRCFDRWDSRQSTSRITFHVFHYNLLIVARLILWRDHERCYQHCGSSGDTPPRRQAAAPFSAPCRRQIQRDASRILLAAKVASDGIQFLE